MAFEAKQYETAEPFFGAADANVVHPLDKKRIQAYDLYEGLFTNNPNSLKIVLRGDDALPIYMPSAKKIVNAINRFLGKNMDYFVEPETLDGQPLDEGTRTVLEQYFKNLYKREAIKKKFGSSKRWGLIRADAVFMITGDPNKEATERLSIHELNPRQVFAIDDQHNINRTVGYHIVERVRDFREDDPVTTKEIARRTTYKKEQTEDGDFTGQVLHSVTHWEIGKWDDRVLAAGDMEQVPYPDQDEDEEPLPGNISELPIYKWTTDAPQNSDWGTSVLSGMETLVFAINQSLTDEDLTLVMQGLGMFVTNAAPPINVDTGEVQSWNVGPGQVIEIGPEQEFTNVTGVSSVSPFQDHMNFVDEKGLAEASGTPAVAIGRVDVTVAESGISLQLQMDPLIAANAERELELYTVFDQMHHDIVSMWIPSYEGIQTNGAVVSTVFDDPMPVNKVQIVQDVVLLRTSNLILTSMAVDKLSELGWKYPPEMSVDEVVEALKKQASDDSAALDPFAAGGSDAGGTDPEVDEFGDPIPPEPDETTVDLGVT